MIKRGGKKLSAVVRPLEYRPIVGVPICIGDEGVQQQITGPDIEGLPLTVCRVWRSAQVPQTLVNRLQRVPYAFVGVEFGIQRTEDRSAWREFPIARGEIQTH